jgi:cytochrome c5
MIKQLLVTALACTAAATAQTAPTEYHAMLTKYCVTCHNEKLKIPAGAPLSLDKADLDDVTADPVIWEKVIRKLGVGAMPPQGVPHPDAAALSDFQTWLSVPLDRAANAKPNPGRFALHRLNRAEYANAIRDLLGIKVDITGLLPPDSSDFGFDNIATVLKVTPALLERYLTAAVRISALAVGEPKPEPVEDKFPIRIDFTQNGYIEGLPLGSRGGTLIHYNFPVDADYIFAGSLFRPVDSADSGIEGQDAANQFEISIDGERVHVGRIGGPEDHIASRQNLTAARDAVAERMKARVHVTAGAHDVGFTFVAQPARSQDIYQLSLRSSEDIHVGSDLPKLSRVSISGPVNPTGVSETATRTRLFVCRPKNAADETRCAKQILSTVAQRAYRRPVTAADIQPAFEFYQQGRKNGDFDSGIRAALPRILAGPAFLFRSESDPAALAPNTPHLVTDLELASRLSFFLWSSIPDDELLHLAIQGRLRAPGVLERQVRRMLIDDRSAALTTNFPDQWLALRNLEKAAPDLLGFPDWDLNLRESLQRETELFFGSIVREDKSALDLLNADYTFVNERLARHYGIPNVYGPDFRRITLNDPNRRGLLGQGSILTLTSVATRTSPVFRGKWILTNLLSTPPLPPPPNVPALAENAGAAKPRSVRERLEEHRKSPVCASCHRNMDPIGFALENFDAVGQWRAATEAGTSVDASGVLVDGTPIDGPSALRKALAARPNVFAGTLTEKLLTYALGRGLETYDMPVVRHIVSDASLHDYRMMSIILGIVQSRPFQMRVKIAEGEAE